MDFTLEELRDILEEMGLKNVPESHLEPFAKELKHLMKHEKHVQKRKRAMGEASSEDSPRPTTSLPLPTTMLPTSVVSTITHATSNKQTVRPATSYHPPPQHLSFELSGQPKSGESAMKTAGNQQDRKSTGSTAPMTEREKAKLEEAKWKKLRTDPVRLYGWYKTHWDFHGLE